MRSTNLLTYLTVQTRWQLPCIATWGRLALQIFLSYNYETHNVAYHPTSAELRRLLKTRCFSHFKNVYQLCTLLTVYTVVIFVSWMMECSGVFHVTEAIQIATMMTCSSVQQRRIYHYNRVLQSHHQEFRHWGIAQPSPLRLFCYHSPMWLINQIIWLNE